jgi:hypothetical protein
MVSEVSVHGQLAPVLLGLWEGENIMVEGRGGREREGEKERGQGLAIPFKNTAPDTHSLQPEPTS